VHAQIEASWKLSENCSVSVEVRLRQRKWL